MCRMTFWFVALWLASSCLPSSTSGEPPDAPADNAAAVLAKVRDTLKGLKSYRFEHTTTIEEAAADGKRTPVAEVTFVTIADFKKAAPDADFPDAPATIPLPVPFKEGRFRFELTSPGGTFLLVGDGTNSWWYSSKHKTYRRGDTLWSLSETILGPVLANAHVFPFMALTEGIGKEAKVVREEEIKVGKERRKCVVIRCRAPLPDFAAIAEAFAEASKGKSDELTKADLENLVPKAFIAAGWHVSKLKSFGYLGEEGPAGYSTPAKTKEQLFTTVTLWIDKEKSLPVRVEFIEDAQRVAVEKDQAAAGVLVKLHVTESFTTWRINEQLDSDLFRFVPPEEAVEHGDGAIPESILQGASDTWRHFAGGGIFRTQAPDLSADGSQIVFASPKTGHGDIYLFDVGKKQAKRLTTSEKTEVSPRFRPKHEQVLFERDDGRGGHVWLYDLATGKERQLTEGLVFDNIGDVSPDGQLIVVRRSSAAAGSGRRVAPFLWSIDRSAKTDLPDDFFGHFRGNGKTLLGSQYTADGYRIVEVDLQGRIVKEHAQEFTIQAMDGVGKRFVVSPIEKTKEYQINSKLILWDLETDKRVPIGKGHSVCMFENGKVLFFTGYERDAWLWESGREPRKIESPATVLDVPHRIVGNRAAVSATWQSNEPMVFVFDAEAEKFERIYWQVADGVK